jgi:hypothetical protein
MLRWFLAAVLLLALALPAGAQAPAPRSLIVLSDTPLTALNGLPDGQARAFGAWDLARAGQGRYLAARFGPQGHPVAGRLIQRLARQPWPELWLFEPAGLPGPWWVPATAVLGPERPRAGEAAKVGLVKLAWLPSEAVALLSGPASAHAPRLARLREANLPAGLKRRLAAGRIKKGDNFWWVELAWGRPQRSFMVNYISDEQHYVYLSPGRPVLLRFVGGRLSEAPPPAGPGGAKVANPPSHR